MLDDQWLGAITLNASGPQRGGPHLPGLKHQYSIRRGHSNPFSHTTNQPKWSFLKLNMNPEVIFTEDLNTI